MLAEAISCVVHEELNGDYYLTLQYPVSGKLYHDLLAGGSIVATTVSYDSSWSRTSVKRSEVFDIYKHTLPINGVVTFYANHISRRLANSVCYAARAQSPTTVVDSSSPKDWNGATVSISIYNMPSPNYSYFSKPKSVLACLLGDSESLISDSGGEFTFYTGVSNTSPYSPIIKVEWNSRRGYDHGAKVHYGYNMKDINRTVDSTGTYNAVIPYWSDDAGNKTYVTGYVVQPTTPISPVVAVPLDCTQAFNTQPTGSQLTTYARNFLDTNMPWIDADSLTVDFVNGEDVSKTGAIIMLGDTVHAYWGDAGLAKDVRAVSYDYDVLDERYVKIGLGTPEKNHVSITGIDNTVVAGIGGSGPSDYVVDALYKTGSYGSSFTVNAHSTRNCQNDAPAISVPSGYTELCHGLQINGDAALQPAQINSYYVANTKASTSNSVTARRWAIYVKKVTS